MTNWFYGHRVISLQDPQHWRRHHLRKEKLRNRHLSKMCHLKFSNQTYQLLHTFELNCQFVNIPFVPVLSIFHSVSFMIHLSEASFHEIMVGK